MPCALDGCSNYRKVLASGVIRNGIPYSIYCSRICVHKSRIFLSDEERTAWKVRYKTSQWKKSRTKALVRDNYICQRCNTVYCKGNREITVHHITPIKMFKDCDNSVIKETVIDKLDNLISLCTKCHGTIEKTGLDFIPDFEVCIYPSHFLI